MTVFPRFALICVDDDPSILQSLHFQLQKMVNQEAVICEFFESPELALSTLPYIVEQAVKIIFVLSDYQMPKMTGDEFLSIIKSRYPEVKCVMLSGQANDRSVDKLMQEGIIDYFIAKPWTEENLFYTVHDALGKSNLNPSYLPLKQKSM
jgi:DNA-binding NtrC family response regulator